MTSYDCCCLVDDHVVVRSGFAQLLNLEPDIEGVGQYSAAAPAWAALTKSAPDVTVLDVAMPDESGLNLLKRLRQHNPQFRAIILSIYDTTAFVQSALDAGLVAISPSAVALRSWYKRYALLAWAVTIYVPIGGDPAKVLISLTARECEIFNLLVKGESVKDIAELLLLSHKTVHLPRANILGKLPCESPVDLVHFALEHQLLAGH